MELIILPPLDTLGPPVIDQTLQYLDKGSV
jgi:hypothetical protein